MQKSTKAVIFITLISLALLVIVPQALAANYKIVGDANGLTIEALPEGQDTGNLNPGDEKISALRLKNTNDDDVTVWIRTNITGNRPGSNGGDLAEVLHLLIKDGDREITDDSFKNAAADGNVLIGTMDPGEEIILDFTVTLPGPGTGNEYQGSAIDANWTFTTQSDPGGGPDRPRRPRNPSEPEGPPVEIPEEPIPGGPAEVPGGEPPEPDILIIEEEPVPEGTAMPKTGEIPPAFFYGLGSLAVVMGVAVRKRKK